MNWKKRWIMIATAAVLWMGATFTDASARCGDPAGGHRTHGPGQLLGFLHRLDLSDAQKTQVAGILKQLEPETKEALQGMVEARKDLVEVTMSNAGNEASVRQAAARVSACAEQLAVIRARAIGQIIGVLTPEQKVIVEEMKGKLIERLGNLVDTRLKHLDAWIARHSK